MKTLFTFLTVISALVCAPAAHAQTINWGSEVFSSLADSTGAQLDNTFVFEMGAFNSGFTPEESNTDDWFTNWRVFDQASYSQSNGYFTSTVEMSDDGTSPISAGGVSFEGLDAYLWVRKGNDPVPGSEWLLVRADQWVYPTAIPGCCNNGLPLEWSVSDLKSTVPNWGSQGGHNGPGESTDPGPYDLQTYTFVPEPSAALMAAIAGLGLTLRRRRAD